MTQLLTANTHLNPQLRLVDFSKSNPAILTDLIHQSIDKASAQLDQLELFSENLDAEQALTEIMAFDHLAIDIDRSWGILAHLNSVMSNEAVRDAHHQLLPTLSAYSTRLGQHQGLFNRYQAVKQDKVFFDSLPVARKRAIELALRGFKLSGVALPIDKQAQYAQISSQLSTLSAQFTDNILDATQAFALPLTEAQLSGITDSGLALLANAGEQYKAKLADKLDNDDSLQQAIDKLPTYSQEQHLNGLYVATLDIPVYLEVMTYADDRQLRETLYNAYVIRASELDKHLNSKGQSLDNADNMSQILALREQKATLLGFKDYSELSLATKMADSGQQVEHFLRELAEKATPFAKKDLAELTETAIKLGVISDNDCLQPWDTAYIAEKVKQDNFNLSQEEIRPYFPLPSVIEGLFAIVKRLFSITVRDCSDDVPLWHPDVRFYQLYDGDECREETLIGGFYFDLYARQGKRGGAWMSGFQCKYKHVATGYSQLPVCFMVANFAPPTTDGFKKPQPSQLTHNEVTTLFHEFGHGLHHLLTEMTVGDVSGINGVEWDAVELPSQFLENWAWDGEGIKLISRHVDTGESLPIDKLNALQQAKNFQSGMQTLRQVEFALFDLLIHSQCPAPNYAGLQKVLDEVRSDIALMETPSYNRFANGFSHIFAGGYACGYFSYKWAELLSADAFGKFEEEGVFNVDTGDCFRQNILAVGGSQPAQVSFENFRGREARIDALLRHSGFV